MSLTLVVLAAGIGSRYGGLKQMDPMGPTGELIIDYSVFDAIRAGFDTVVFVISRKIEPDFKPLIGARLERRVRVQYVIQELTSELPAAFAISPDRKKPWGTGHAVLVCRSAIQTPFAVINADDFYGHRSFVALAEFLKKRSVDETRYSMVGFLLRNTLSEHGHVARGICDVDGRGLLRSVVERTRIEKTPTGARFAMNEAQWQTLTGNEIVSMNMWGFTPSIFRFLSDEFPRFLSSAASDPKAEFFIPSVADKLIQEKKSTVEVLKTPESWFGVTYQEDKPIVVRQIRHLIESGIYPSRLWT
jgi:UTP-glucose-1-phosphate uridylyltransferase